jgi:hypothetical protein
LYSTAASTWPLEDEAIDCQFLLPPGFHCSIQEAPLSVEVMIK